MSINILIIEDEVDIREGISEYLSEVGYDKKGLIYLGKINLI